MATHAQPAGAAAPSTPTQPSCRSLGALAILPGELRCEIWQYITLTAAKPRLAILLASRQIHAEASNPLYGSFHLYFHIGSTYVPNLWIGVTSNSPLDLNRSLQSLKNSKEQGYGMLPYHRLGKIRITIEAPSSEDPGQVICLFKKCTSLAKMLESAQSYQYGLPDIEIILMNSHLEDNLWISNGQPHRTVSNIWNDMQIVTLPFARIRGARSATIEYHKHKPNSYYIDNIARLIRRKAPFGTLVAPGSPWNDATIRKKLNEMFMQIERRLDDSRGETANMLRLEHLATWFIDSNGFNHMRECEKILGTWEHEIQERARQKLQWRQRAAKAINPNLKPYWDLQSSLDRLCFNLIPKSDNVHAFRKAKGPDMNDELDTWHKCYPKGLPPLASDAFYGALIFHIEPRIGNYNGRLRDLRQTLRNWAMVNGLKNEKCIFASCEEPFQMYLQR